MKIFSKYSLHALLVLMLSITSLITSQAHTKAFEVCSPITNAPILKDGNIKYVKPFRILIRIKKEEVFYLCIGRKCENEGISDSPTINTITGTGVIQNGVLVVFADRVEKSMFEITELQVRKNLKIEGLDSEKNNVSKGAYTVIEGDGGCSQVFAFPLVSKKKVPFLKKKATDQEKKM